MSHNGHANGSTPQSRMNQLLTGEPLTQGYTPTMPLWAYGVIGVTESFPQFYLRRDIELMMIHPIVRSALNFFKAGISSVEFDPKAETQEVTDFIHAQCTRWWDRGVPKVQGGYEYGWIGGEHMFTERDGPLRWDGLIQFSPLDTFLLTQGRGRRPVGMRVKNVPARDDLDLTADSGRGAANAGTRDLWFAEGAIPAKAMWYAHDPRYNQFYGQSQLLGAWRPWRRLAWKDAAETVIDGGVYRFAYSGPIVGYPSQDQIAQAGSPATTLDSQGRPRRYNRDMAREMADQFKAGAGIGLPSECYPPDQGGKPKWTFEIPQSTINVDGLISYAQYLCDQIRYGVGVPPELLEASETGSGYSGRSIPLEGFMMTQQRLANAMLTMFVYQVLRPLIRRNWGDVKWDVKVKPLLETKRKSMDAQQQDGQAAAGNTPGQQEPQAHGMPPAEGMQPGAGGATQWMPHQGSQGQGWISPGGKVAYGPHPPGGAAMSMDRIRAIAEKIRRAA